MDNFDEMITIKSEQRGNYSEAREEKGCECDCNFDYECFAETFPVKFPRCQIAKDASKNIYLDSEGRILKLNIKIKKVCRGRKVAVGVVVCEGNKIKGLKIREVVARGNDCSPCTDICEEFCFVFEEPNVCDERCFEVKVIAHYVC